MMLCMALLIDPGGGSVLLRKVTVLFRFSVTQFGLAFCHLLHNLRLSPAWLENYLPARGIH